MKGKDLFDLALQFFLLHVPKYSGGEFVCLTWMKAGKFGNLTTKDLPCSRQTLSSQFALWKTR